MNPKGAHHIGKNLTLGLFSTIFIDHKSVLDRVLLICKVQTTRKMYRLTCLFTKCLKNTYCMQVLSVALEIQRSDYLQKAFGIVV